MATPPPELPKNKMDAYAWTPEKDYPKFPIPPEVNRGALEALERGETHYTPVAGVPPLRQAVAEFLSGMGCATIGANNVIVVAGEQEARALSLLTVCGDGQSVAVPSIGHPGVLRALQLRLTPVIRMENWAPHGLTAPDIGAVLETGARVVYLESPNWLTGELFDRSQVEGIASVLKLADAYLLWDQSLGPLCASGTTYQSLGAFPEILDRVLMLGRLWPAMGMEDYQLGYIACGEELAKRVQKTRQIVGIHTSSPSQWAGVAAHRVRGDYLPERLDRLEKARGAALRLIQDEGLSVLQGETSSLVAFRHGPSRIGPLLRRLEESGGMIVDGRAFGAPDVVRVTLSPFVEQ